MTRSKKAGTWAPTDLSRRELMGATAGAGALLALSPHTMYPEVSDRGPRRETFFLNLSHENYSGHEYHLFIAGQRYPLQEMSSASPTALRILRSNSFLSALPSRLITHVLEGILLPSAQVLLCYNMKDPNRSSGEWQMSNFFLIPPMSGLPTAYQRARAKLDDAEALPLSAKRAQYGLPAARTYKDLVEERMLLDSNDWAAALINVHPEMLSADGDSAAHIQINHINTDHSLLVLAQQLSGLGPAMPQIGSGDNPEGWATLVPYKDKDGKTLTNQTGQNKKLNLYDAKWNTNLKQNINFLTNIALAEVKNDPSLGVNIADSAAPADARGAVWTRTDGVTAVDQTAGATPAPGAADVNFALTNVTPSFNGYQCTVTNSGTSVTLSATNWYLRYLGLFIQFLKEEKDGTTSIVNPNDLPSGTFPDGSYITPDKEILLDQISPEFVIYGIPVKSSNATFTFPFPSAQATSARIIASGLGVGSETAKDTENLGIIMTTIFNFVLPTTLMALGAGTTVDSLVLALGVPYAKALALVIEADAVDLSLSGIGSIFWKFFVRGFPKILLKFATVLTATLGGEAAAAAAEDFIPIAGVILQAIGIAGTLAELAESTAETLLSPWSYIYTLVGTYDLTVSILADPNHQKVFPTTAATYQLKAVLSNGYIYTMEAPMPSGGGSSLQATFKALPLGGTVVVSTALYSVDGQPVGRGSVGPQLNDPSAPSPMITISEIAYPISASTVYQHQQHTTIDSSNGHHTWVCAPAPPAPGVTSDCIDKPGHICNYREITVSTSTGYIGYAWQAFTPVGCNGGEGQLDQMANIAAPSAVTDAQSSYAALSCGLSGTGRLAYNPLGHNGGNFYLDQSGAEYLLRAVTLDPPSFQAPGDATSWGKFNLLSNDLLLHPSGAAISINLEFHRLESLQLPPAGLPDKRTAQELVAQLHGGFGTRPGLFSSPILATVDANGVVLVLESGNNRIHAVDAAGNPVRHFPKQPEPYFLVLNATGAGTTYLDIASEYSGLVYILSVSAGGVYRLDIYDPMLDGTALVSTTRDFYAARVAVDYWRNVYSLNYVTLPSYGNPPVTEPQISQWLPTTPPQCATDQPSRTRASLPGSRLLRRRDLLRFQPTLT